MGFNCGHCGMTSFIRFVLNGEKTCVEFGTCHIEPIVICYLSLLQCNMYKNCINTFESEEPIYTRIVGKGGIEEAKDAGVVQKKSLHSS